MATFRELLGARDLLRSFVERDLILRYRTPVFGVAWAVATPLAQMAIFALVFTRVAPIDAGMPYPLFAYIGLSAWTFTAGALREAMTSLSSNAVLVTKVRFPREVLPLAAVCTGLIDFTVASLLTLGLMWFYGTGISWAFLLFPVVVIVQLTFTAALALLLAVANLLWRDVRYVFDVVILVWMFSTAVVYPLQNIGGRAGELLALNPMTHIVEAYRDVMVRGRGPTSIGFAVTGVAAFVLLAMAWSVFRTSERRFAELA